MSSKGLCSTKLQDYIVLEMLGEGVFGQVLHCINSKTSEVVALKVLKQADESNLLREVEMLKQVRELDPTKHNIVKFFDYFTWNGYSCMAFEMLDCSLYDATEKRMLSLSEIRVVTQQLLVAFDALKQENIIHTDLKADNVMLVNHKNQPYTVRLIDFGQAQHKSELKIGTYVQPRGLRAPEVILGLPLTEAIDMWSLGCLLIDLYIGYTPFSGSSEYDHQRTIVKMLGYPPDDLLSQGIYTRWYYYQTSDGQWRLMSPEEYTNLTGKDPKVESNDFERYINLEDAILSTPTERQFPEFSDRLGFINLVLKLLNLDYRRRITPSEALQHPFITLDYFENENDEAYVQWARDLQNQIIKNNSQSSSVHAATKHEHFKTLVLEKKITKEWTNNITTKDVKEEFGQTEDWTAIFAGKKKEKKKQRKLNCTFDCNSKNNPEGELLEGDCKDATKERVDNMSKQDVKQESLIPSKHDPGKTCEESELGQTEERTTQCDSNSGYIPPVIAANTPTDNPVVLIEDKTQTEIYCVDIARQRKSTFSETSISPFELEEDAPLNTKDHEKKLGRNRNIFRRVKNWRFGLWGKFTALFRR